MTRVGVIDYGAGNLRSLANALEAVGGEPVFVTKPEELAGFERLILPGVGAFRPAMETLHAAGLVAPIKAHAASGAPLMGVCLGMQLICTRSFENGETEGLGLIDADVVAIETGPDVKSPHIGWNAIERFAGNTHLLVGVEEGVDVYFVHSYVVHCRDRAHALAQTQHGAYFDSIIGAGRTVGAQFHPEKSQSAGLTMLRNFLAL